jgi:UDP-N-acetylglucosamine--N-acetylmuramyl-(pentapeptide) pyrophosphoryl-undecaprenol N-acetylglucosamine transferase
LILAGGGTGGHLFPALAVAKALIAEQKSAEVLFVGSRWGIEAEMVEREGFPFQSIPIRGIVGRGLKGIGQALWGIPASLLLSRKIFKEFKPQVVLGVGGYAAGPPLAAALWMKIPTAIMEQNVKPGLTNRILGRLVKKVFVGFEESQIYYDPSKTERTGIPIRWEWIPMVRKEKFTLLILGGSAGAHRINLEIVRALRHLDLPKEELRIIHQTGKKDETWVRDAYREMGFLCEVSAFFPDMAEVYSRTDLVVCRAGAGTVAELTAYGLPAIFIPYPFAAGDHQRINAEKLVQKGAGRMILESDITEDLLAREIEELFHNSKRRASMAEQARTQGTPGAARLVLSGCRSLVSND